MLINEKNIKIWSTIGARATLGIAALDLAKNNDNSPITLTEISLRQGISLSFLEQLFFRLKKNNLVLSSRGPKGGYILSRSPNEIKLSTIIEAVDEKIKPVKLWYL